MLDDDGRRHVRVTAAANRQSVTVEGGATTVQRVGDRIWRLPVTAFWQSHRDAAARYSAVVGEWLGGCGARRAWDLYGGAGLFAAALAEVVGPTGQVISVDTARSVGSRACGTGRPAGAGGERVGGRFLAAQTRAPTSRRAGPAAGRGGPGRSSPCWPVLGVPGSSTSVVRLRHSPAISASTARRVSGSRDHGVRRVPADPSRGVLLRC